MILKDKLEKLLLANWASFIDYRKLLHTISEHIGTTVKQIKLSRFEYEQAGFVVWAECQTPDKQLTIEMILTSDNIQIQNILEN